MAFWIWIIIALVYGLVVGSFLNVVIYRLPRGGSLIQPTWSYCPRCEHRLGAIDLFPVLSFAFLGARCRYCREPISWRYPAVELLTGVMFAAVAWRFGGTWDTIFYCLFAAVLICVFLIDLEHFIIPDGLNVTLAVIGFAHNGVALWQGELFQTTRLGSLSVPASLVGFIGYGAVLYLIGLLSYVWIVAGLDKRKSAGRATAEYISENVQDWVFITLYYLGAVIPPLRRWAVARFGDPGITEGTTAEDIESDEDAGGMGGGDGKLAAAIGANLYLPHALLSLGAAVMLGALAGVVVLAVTRRRLGSRVPIPFGPAMAGGALLALFFGGSFLSWYSWYTHHV